MSTALATRIAEEYAAAAAELPARVVSAARRELAVQALNAQGLPATRDENWKYANLRALERVRFAPPSAKPGGAAPATPWPESALPAPIAGYARHTYVDGVFAPELSSAARLDSADGTPAHGRPHSGDARFALLNDAFASDTARVRASAGPRTALKCCSSPPPTELSPPLIHDSTSKCPPARASTSSSVMSASQATPTSSTPWPTSTSQAAPA